VTSDKGRNRFRSTFEPRYLGNGKRWRIRVNGGRVGNRGWTISISQQARSLLSASCYLASAGLVCECVNERICLSTRRSVMSVCFRSVTNKQPRTPWRSYAPWYSRFAFATGRQTSFRSCYLAPVGLQSVPHHFIENGGLRVCDQMILNCVIVSSL
jgi:hypothetical protein